MYRNALFFYPAPCQKKKKKCFPVFLLKYIWVCFWLGPIFGLASFDRAQHTKYFTFYFIV